MTPSPSPSEHSPQVEQSTQAAAQDFSEAQPRFGFSPWIALFVAIVLCLATLGSVFSNYHGAVTTMERILLEKGASLIRSFEAGARMRMRHASDIRLQLLLEEMASQEDIRFTVVISKEGLILAHSDPALIDTSLMDTSLVDGVAVIEGVEQATLPNATDAPQWQIMTLGGTTSFVVYEAFNPLYEMGSGPNPDGPNNAGPRQDGPHHSGLNHSRPQPNASENGLQSASPSGPENKGPKHSSHSLPERPKEFWDTITSLRSTNTDGAIMLVGLNIDPLTAAQAQDRRIRSLVLILLLGSALLSALALWRFQKERLAQQKERLAQQKERMAQQKERLAQQKEQQAQEQVRALEAEIRQREKQAAMGHLAAGVAHELRNPLSSIKGYATYFGTRFPEGSEDRHAAAIMVQEVDRLNRVITDLINLAKPSDLHLIDHSPEDLHLLVDRALRLMHHEAVARGVTVHFHCADDLPTTALDPDRFLQALLNVWLNALDALKDTHKGNNAASSAQERGLYVDLRGSANGKLHVTTRDTGSGIAPDQLSKICDPYFTTKPQGTGLGLAIVQKIIEAHGGKMDVASELGVGTVIDFVM